MSYVRQQRTSWRNIAVLILASGFAAACGPSEQSVVSAEAPLKTTEPDAVVADSDIDLFTLVIDAERWGVMMDNAGYGATAFAMRETQPMRSDLFRLDYALRSGARQLIALRDGLCVDGLDAETTCVSLALPEWVLAAPDDVEGVSMAEYQARSDWLGEQAQPFIAAGCEAGRVATGEEMFCAVE